MAEIHTLKWLDDNQYSDDEEKNGGDFVQDAVITRRAFIFRPRKPFPHGPKHMMEPDKKEYQCELGMQPTLASKGRPRIVNKEPYTEDRGQKHIEACEPVEAVFHRAKSTMAFFVTWASVRIEQLNVVYEESRQIEEAREPRDHKNQMKRLDPQHA